MLDLDITFNRDYLAHRFGAIFDDRYFTDWRHRLETNMAVQRGLAARFGDMNLGNPDPQPRIRLGFDDTLNMTLLFGPLWSVKGAVSWVHPGFLSTADSIERLTVPDMETTWPNTFLVQQYEEAIKELGHDNVIPPRPHGVLEAAMDLRGEKLLTDFYDSPELVDKLLGVLTETVIRFQEFWLKKRGGEPWEDIVLGGCATTMLSPRVFERFLLPHYEDISDHFGGGFLCACGPSTHLLDSFAKIRHCRYFRLGWGTDLQRGRMVLGARHIKASLNPARVAQQPPHEVRHDVLQVIEACGRQAPLSILLIHVGADMPDENIRAFYEAIQESGGRLVAAPKAP